MPLQEGPPGAFQTHTGTSADPPADPASMEYRGKCPGEKGGGNRLMRICVAKGLPFWQVSEATVPFLLVWCFEPQTSSYFLVHCLLTSF